MFQKDWNGSWIRDRFHNEVRQEINADARRLKFTNDRRLLFLETRNPLSQRKIALSLPGHKFGIRFQYSG